MSVKTLPLGIKQLLKGRNPNSLISPPLERLHQAFTQTRESARSRPVNAEKGWLVLSTCAALTANCPPAVGHLYKFATRAGSSRVSVSEAAEKASLMRESALKSAIFTGVPRSILSLAALADAWEEDVKASLRKDAVRIHSEESVRPTLARGRNLWDSIYEPHAQKLHDKLNAYHPDFMCEWMRTLIEPMRLDQAFVISSYGSVLAPLPGGEHIQGNLGRALTSVVGSACLRAEGGVGPQLTSHVFGLLKARDSPELSDEERWLASDEGTEWVLRTTDIIVDAVKATDVAELDHHKAKL